MPCPSDNNETSPYLLALIIPDGPKILGLRSGNRYALPTVDVPRGQRPAATLQSGIREKWGLTGIVLDILPSPTTLPALVVMELFSSPDHEYLIPLQIQEVDLSSCSDLQKRKLEDVITGRSVDDPFTQIGWIEEAIEWVESATGSKVSSKYEIEQLNAGGHFSLIRFRTRRNRDYWLKATGAPNIHEFSLTMALAKLGSDHLPDIVSTKPEWNAWLTVGEPGTVDDLPSDSTRLSKVLEDAVVSMAKLQMATIGSTVTLLKAGAFDQRIEKLYGGCDPLFDFLIEAMRKQTSIKVSPLGSDRVNQLRSLVKRSCEFICGLDIPPTIVHGDLNRNNISIGKERCKFLDWCEAYVGCPFVSLQHLVRIAEANDPSKTSVRQFLLQRYSDTWATVRNSAQIEAGFTVMPLLAIASTLYGRGDWINTAFCEEPQRQSYCRTLARHLDRAAQDPKLLEALCD